MLHDWVCWEGGGRFCVSIGFGSTIEVVLTNWFGELGVLLTRGGSRVLFELGEVD